MPSTVDVFHYCRHCCCLDTGHLSITHHIHHHRRHSILSCHIDHYHLNHQSHWLFAYPSHNVTIKGFTFVEDFIHFMGLDTIAANFTSRAIGSFRHTIIDQVRSSHYSTSLSAFVDHSTVSCYYLLEKTGCNSNH